MKIKIGIPFAKYSRISAATLESVRQIAQAGEIEVTTETQQDNNIPRARNALINENRSNLIYQKLEDFDYFLCVDSDIAFSMAHIKRLLKHDLDIVSGAYVHKETPDKYVAGWFPQVDGISLMKDRVSTKKTGLVDVDWTGAGFLLLKRTLLERLPYPWFTCMEVTFKTYEGKCAILTSDGISFSIKAKQNGMKVKLDADCQVNRIVHPNQKSAFPDENNRLLQQIRKLNNENRELKAQLTKR
jgi:hypothetical protein